VTLADQAALEFRQRPEHVKYEPSLRSRRVEGFGQAAKADASQPQFLDGLDQLLHRARQAVKLPHDQRVAAARKFQRLPQSGAIRHRARQLLGENPPASRFGERVPLQGEVLARELAGSTDTRIDLDPGQGTPNVSGMWETSGRNGFANSHVYYDYYCKGTKRSDPIYAYKQSPACGLWN
jgi:hypothetical protein